MDAVVTLKMSPAEYDVMCKALEGFAEEQSRLTNDKNQTAGVRSLARRNDAQTRDLLTKLKR